MTIKRQQSIIRSGQVANPNKLKLDLRLIDRSLAENSLAEFAKQSWPIIEPATALLWNWHLDLICEHLEQVALGKITRLIVNVPPRSMKSLLISIFFMCWMWATKPWTRFLCASYSAQLALKHSRDRRALLTSPWYQRNWNLQLAEDSNTQAGFTNANRGHMIASSVGASVTGRGGDILIVDDLINPEQANSEAERTSALRFFDESLYSRLDDKRRGAIVVVEQRTNAADLTGHLLPDGTWTHLCLPAEFEQRTTYSFPRSGREVERNEGDLLWPEREGRAELDSAKQRVGSYAYNSQWLQRPVSREGNYFKREWFRRYHTAPARFSRLVQSWDTAFKQKSTSDYSAMVTVGVVSERSVDGAQPGFYILNAWRGRVEFPQLKRLVVEFASFDRPDEVLIEDTAAGQSLIQELMVDTNINLRPIKVDTDKGSRASAATIAAEAGRVYLPANQDWVEQFLDEVCSFPAAPHDDWLDAFTQALNYLRPLEGGRGSVRAFISGWEEAQRRLADPSYRNPMEQIYEETTRRLQGRSHCSFCHGPIPSGTSSIDERHLGRIHVACFYKRQNRPG